MRKLLWFAALVVVAAARVIAAPELPILDPARVTERKLPNGLSLVVKEERQWPVVAIGAYIRAGSLYEGAGEIGAAHLVEHLLFETTGDGDQKLAPFIEGLGGRIVATTMRDFVHVDIVVASRYLEQVLPVFTKAIFEANFTPAQLSRETAVVKREIADRDERADLYINDLIWQTAYDHFPYGRPIGGTEKELDALTLDAVKRFHSRFYVPNNITLLAVGDVDPAWLEGRLKELTASQRAQETGWTAPALDPPLTEPRLKTEALPREVSLLALAWRAPGVADKSDVCAMDLIYTILGQGPLGRLNSKLIGEQRLLLTVQTDFLTQKYPGLLVITALVHPTKEVEAQAAIVTEVKQLAEQPVSAEELDRAKRLLYTEYAFSNESYDDQVGSMGFYASIDNYRFALDYISQVMKITPEQLQQVAKKYLQQDGYALVLLHGKSSDHADEAAMLP